VWSTASLTRIAEHYRSLVHPRVGIITGVKEEPPLPGEPGFPMMTARLSAIDRLFPIAGFSPIGGGTALDPLEAFVRACGEATERYCGFLAAPGPYTTYAELPARGISPADWPRCAPEAYGQSGNPLSPPDSRRLYHWSEGWSLLTREPVFVPTLQVSLGYRPDDPSQLVSLPHSTGLAAGDTFEAATLSGLCEVLERDAFMVTWCRRLPAAVLSFPPNGWPEVAERQRRLAQCELDLRLHALMPEVPPAKVMALLFDRPGGSVPVACGLGASVEPGRAAAKAIDEAVQSRRSLLLTVTQASPCIPERPEDVRSLPDHLTYYLQPERLQAFEFLFSAPTCPPTALNPIGGGTPGETLNRLVNTLGNRGYEVICVDLTTPDVAEAGFRVVRVIVPGLIPLTHGHAMRPLGCPRWQQFPGELTPFPHPFG